MIDINLIEANPNILKKALLNRNKQDITDELIELHNKYLAIGEVDFTGTIIKSYVKIISAELAQTTPDNSIVYIYEADDNSIITNIKYYKICNGCATIFIGRR